MARSMMPSNPGFIRTLADNCSAPQDVHRPRLTPIRGTWATATVGSTWMSTACADCAIAWAPTEPARNTRNMPICNELFMLPVLCVVLPGGEETGSERYR